MQAALPPAVINAYEIGHKYRLDIEGG